MTRDDQSLSYSIVSFAKCIDIWDRFFADSNPSGSFSWRRQVMSSMAGSLLMSTGIYISLVWVRNYLPGCRLEQPRLQHNQTSVKVVCHQRRPSHIKYNRGVPAPTDLRICKTFVGSCISLSVTGFNLWWEICSFLLPVPIWALVNRVEYSIWSSIW